MIRSSACQPWQPDLPGHAGDRGDLLSYTTPWDTIHTCSEPAHLSACPVPRHDLRNGRLNQTAYALFFFLRDVYNGDLVAWIDARLAAADDPGRPDRAALMRQALLEPLCCIHGVSSKVLSMALTTSSSFVGRSTGRSAGLAPSYVDKILKGA